MLDIETGGAVGLHFSGTSGLANYAVTASALAQLVEDKLWGQVVLPAPVRIVPPEVVPEEEKPKATDYIGRDGYQPRFLGSNAYIRMPRVAPNSRHAPAQLLDGGGVELKYCHFSVVVDANRSFPVITGVNIDGERLRRVPGGKTWKKDPRIPADAQVGNEVYTNKNLDRGHMVRRLDPVWGALEDARLANADTFPLLQRMPA